MRNMLVNASFRSVYPRPGRGADFALPSCFFGDIKKTYGLILMSFSVPQKGCKWLGGRQAARRVLSDYEGTEQSGSHRTLNRVENSGQEVDE